jgi:hypothetical protein
MLTFMAKKQEVRINFWFLNFRGRGILEDIVVNGRKSALERYFTSVKR